MRAFAYFLWIMISPITFGALIPVLFAVFICDSAFLVVLVYILYSIIWFVINEKIN